jgi:hypothetical protein
MSDKNTSLEALKFVEEDAIGSPLPRHIVFCIHGIRDDASWATNLMYQVEGKFADIQIILVPLTHERISSYSFISGMSTKKAAEDLHRQIISVIRKLNDENIDVNEDDYSFLCHSNGCKVLSYLFKDLEFEVQWIFLAGSVCRLIDASVFRPKQRVINEVGVRDIWPWVAELLRPDLYGATGVYGFHRPPVLDRFFKYKHSEALTFNHFREWIAPIILTGRAKRTPVIYLKRNSIRPVHVRRLTIILIIALMYVFWSNFFL